MQAIILLINDYQININVINSDKFINISSTSKKKTYESGNYKIVVNK